MALGVELPEGRLGREPRARRGRCAPSGPLPRSAGRARARCRRAPSRQRRRRGAEAEVQDGGGARIGRAVGQAGGDADADVAEAAVEDDRAVARAGEPGAHEARGRVERLLGPGDRLAELPVAAARDVAGRLDAVAERRAAGRDVLEEVAARPCRRRGPARRATSCGSRGRAAGRAPRARRRWRTAARHGDRLWREAVTRSPACAQAVAGAGAAAAGLPRAQRRRRAVASVEQRASLPLMGRRLPLWPARPAGDRPAVESPVFAVGCAATGGLRQPVAVR